ncbi:ankyrin repeat domain-containing protein 65-like [Penaeus chinensis]|uniref:ankyrin repeat domain-containing protein 65-like n=1 Tax=Penaeus chinensis TaxID=139456 RepID=UPI001FB5B261|nr:ankyrin repeat domain-containing protein 65-like [Penaeus chinensis]
MNKTDFTINKKSSTIDVLTRPPTEGVPTLIKELRPSRSLCLPNSVEKPRALLPDPLSRVEEFPDLVDAVRNGNVEGISSALLRGADQHLILPEDDSDDPGGSLLTLAARLGHAIAVSLLLEAGTPVDHRGRGSRTPLYRAAYMGHADIVDTLLAAGSIAGGERGRLWSVVRTWV